MAQLRKYRHHKRRLNIPSLLVVIIVLGLGLWFLYKDKQRKMETGRGDKQEAVADSLGLVPDAKTKEQAAPTADPKPQEQPAASSKAPAEVIPDSIPADRRPRMKQTGYYILVIKDRHELRLYKDGALQKTYKVGLGKNTGDKAAVGDLRTPEGYFYVNFIRDSGGWSHDFNDGKGPVKGAYGPWFLALYTGKSVTFSQKTWTGIAIHGTHDPSSIGTNVSEGCIRMHNSDIVEMKNTISRQEFVPVDVVASIGSA